MAVIRHPIDPVYDENSRILILGSFPSVKSREQMFFYGHPQNRFWKVTSSVFGERTPETIAEKKAFLLRNRIAVWDVLASCEITGSSDASIRNVTENDLTVILSKAKIETIYVNGRTAEKMYVRYLEKKLGRKCICLPSTSPANAAWNLERLISKWQVIRGDQKMIDIDRLKEEHPILNDIAAGREVAWINSEKEPFVMASGGQALSMSDMQDAERRLRRFAPFILKKFPETASRKGIIESDLIEIEKTKSLLNEKYGSEIEGRLLLKMDSHLAIAGSVKARGGIYEVLKHTEDLAMASGILTREDVENDSKDNTAYLKLLDDRARDVFSRHTVQVGSTGNLGLSIGIISAAIGYKVIVHMSADARQWKKDLLRRHGVTVVEYESDYSEAVIKGRQLSDEDPMSYFVDDENSRDLFLGYSVAALRLVSQLREQDVCVDDEHPLFVYIPCGVGGAPGGISFGLKQVFGDSVHCFFVEPVVAPCMLVGLISGLNNKISVQDVGLTGITDADGLAVGRPSGFVGEAIKHHLSGEFTVRDARLYDYLRDLLSTEKVFLEPSACAAFQGPVRMNGDLQEYIIGNHLQHRMKNAAHIVWATGGSLVPEDIREAYLKHC